MMDDTTILIGAKHCDADATVYEQIANQKQFMDELSQQLETAKEKLMESDLQKEELSNKLDLVVKEKSELMLKLKNQESIINRYAALRFQNEKKCQGFEERIVAIKTELCEVEAETDVAYDLMDELFSNIQLYVEEGSKDIEGSELDLNESFTKEKELRTDLEEKVAAFESKGSEDADTIINLEVRIKMLENMESQHVDKIKNLEATIKKLAEDDEIRESEHAKTIINLESTIKKLSEQNENKEDEESEDVIKNQEATIRRLVAENEKLINENKEIKAEYSTKQTELDTEVLRILEKQKASIVYLTTENENFKKAMNEEKVNSARLVDEKNELERKLEEADLEKESAIEKVNKEVEEQKLKIVKLIKRKEELKKGWKAELQNSERLTIEMKNSESKMDLEVETTIKKLKEEMEEDEKKIKDLSHRLKLTVVLYEGISDNLQMKDDLLTKLELKVNKKDKEIQTLNKQLKEISQRADKFSSDLKRLCDGNDENESQLKRRRELIVVEDEDDAEVEVIDEEDVTEFDY